MGHKDIYFFIGNVPFWVIVCKSEELNPLYFTSSILEEVNVFRKVFDTFCVP